MNVCNQTFDYCAIVIVLYYNTLLLVLLQYAKEVGIPPESCSNYMAVDTTCNEQHKVTNKNKPACYTCSPSGMPSCKPIKTFKSLHVSEFGVCSGYAKMKAEIHARFAGKAFLPLATYSPRVFACHWLQRNCL